MKINKRNLIIGIITIIGLLGFLGMSYSLIKPTYNDKEMNKLAEDYCKDYDGTWKISQSLFGIGVLCNKITGKRLWWDVHEGKMIAPKEEIIQERFVKVLKYLVPLIGVLSLIQIFFRNENKSESKQQLEEVQDE